MILLLNVYIALEISAILINNLNDIMFIMFSEFIIEKRSVIYAIYDIRE